ncbi:hypothetical protein QEZ40_000083 [Streptomyces katrae]|uniref:AAA+ ATPase domain-containing protein n=1 Tax=Streptomyces katrae TaxID=68223 RepID=A0ABT7GKW7_9ACTN|nr:hypothetical protein [Streptomyces katrae]MDK9494214.1 hypothetical protein [Streptomyces katrae]
MASSSFEGLVRRHTGEDRVERRWLTTAVDRALAADSTRLVLVTGEPGSGKTGLLAGLADSRPDWLRYFVGAVDGDDRAAGDISSFLLSIGHQLARRRPELFDVERLSVVVEQHFGEVRPGARATGIRIEDLTVSPFHRTATLVVEQTADLLGGSVLGLEIGTAHLEPRLLAPDNLAQLALVGPARVLLAQDPEARIVILLDALDEAAESGDGNGGGPPSSRGGGDLLHWLATNAVLPPNVSVVVSSRPFSGLDLLRAARVEQLAEIDLAPGMRQISDDLLAFARKALDAAEVNAAVEAKGLLPDQFQRRVAYRASGNFLYLACYARALTDAVQEADTPVVDRLLDLDSLPPQLAGIYGLFVETARQQIEALGMVRLEAAPAGRGSTAYAWETVGQPVLGVLTVAQEPLTEEQLVALSGVPARRRHVGNVIARLRWLLDLRDDRIALYHSSVGEFLRSDLARARHRNCWVDAEEWHEQIVSHYRGPAPSWPQVDWSRMDRYGLAYLGHHLLESGPQLSADAAELPCAGLLSAIRTEFGAERRFLDLVDRTARRFAHQAPPAVGLPTLMYLGVVRHQAARPSTALSPPVLGLLARLGRRKEAVERAASIPPSVQQFAAVGEILRYPGPEDGGPSRGALLELLVESALAIPLGREAPVHVHSAVETVAELLAPHDLDRALRLWDYGQRLGGISGTTPPDDLYRSAAAAEPDTHLAAALIAQIQVTEWKDFFDLARRAGAGQATDLLRRAEAVLESSEPSVRVPGFADLAARWSRYDEAIGRDLLARTREQAHAVREDPRAAGGLVQAARVVAHLDPATARALLGPLDTMKINGYSSGALLRAARLWTDWAEPGRAQTLVDRYLAEIRDPWSRLRALSAVGRSSASDETSVLEEILAGVPGPVRDPDTHPMAVSDRDDELADVVRRMARHDLRRAAQIAGEIQRTTWRPSWLPRYAAAPDPMSDINGEDRNSVLVALAHIHLDRGQTAPAEAILDGLLVARHTPLIGGGPFAYLYSSSAEPSDTPDGQDQRDDLFGEMGLRNLYNDWSYRVHRHFFRDPADVVRAIELGHHGSLATAVRRFAEQLAGVDRPLSLSLIRSIAAPDERAIGLATLHLAAHGAGPDGAGHGPEAEAYSKELDDALAEVPDYRWTIDTDPDSEALAYLRPDHRLCFELAARVRYTCREEDLNAAVDLPYLYRAALCSFFASVSADYPEALARSSPRKPPFEDFHQRNLRLPSEFSAPDPLVAITQAAGAFHEFRASCMVPGHSSRAAEARITNPLYAAAVEALTTGTGPDSAFVQRARQLLDGGTAPSAVSGLLVFAADARPDRRSELRELADHVIASVDSDTPWGQEALAVLAASPLLSHLVNPTLLFRRAGGGTDIMARLFAAVLASEPAVALSTFYEVLSHSWRDAMTLLERASSELPGLVGADAMAAIGSAIVRGLEATSPDVTPPAVVDGIRLAELAAIQHARPRPVP